MKGQVKVPIIPVIEIDFDGHSGAGVSDGILEEVLEDGKEEAVVAVDEEFGGKIIVEGVPRIREPVGESDAHLLHEQSEVERLEGVVIRRLFELGEEGDVVQEGRETGALSKGFVGESRPFVLREILIGEHLEIPFDGRKRGAQLVRDVARELLLEDAVFLRLRDVGDRDLVTALFVPEADHFVRAGISIDLDALHPVSGVIRTCRKRLNLREHGVVHNLPHFGHGRRGEHIGVLDEVGVGKEGMPVGVEDTYAYIEYLEVQLEALPAGFEILADLLLLAENLEEPSRDAVTVAGVDVVRHNLRTGGNLLGQTGKALQMRRMRLGRKVHPPSQKEKKEDAHK